MNVKGRLAAFVSKLSVAVCALVLGLGAPTAHAQGTAGTSPFGPNVIVINPSMSAASINSLLNTANKEAQFSQKRYAVLFMPGTYGTKSSPVSAPIGFYEQISGLGVSPNAVTITGGFAADQLINGDMTQNFWRSEENMAIIPSGGLTDGVLDWGVSQGTSLRRVNIEGGLWLANSGPINGANACQQSSGGFIADSQVEGAVNACSQQQWYTRNSNLPSGFTGFVWNFVFSGVTPANTPQQSFPGGPYGDTNVTNLPTTPVSREKPFLYVDNSGNYNVFVPTFQKNSSGVPWTNTLGATTPSEAGVSHPLSDFLIATPSTTITEINSALATGKHLILTPGVYQYSEPINVTVPYTVVLGMGYATIQPLTGKQAITVDDVEGVTISGLLIDAGSTLSPALVQVGDPRVINQPHADPTSLHDIFFRVGGNNVPGAAFTSLQVDSNNVILDNIWAWRADHGNPGTFGWTQNPAAHGLVVNGSDVTALGLAVEHYQQEQVLWNGDNGTTIFYQSELPYDVPSQSSWVSATQQGFPSYVVTPDSVCTHSAYGLGVYSYFNQGVSIVDSNAITVPDVTGVKIVDAGTVFLNGSGSITNVVNGTGGQVASTNAAKLNPLASFVGKSTCTATRPKPGSTVPLVTLRNPNPNNFDPQNIMRATFIPHADLTLLSAHRGLHAVVGQRNASGIPENSLEAIGKAAQDGWEMIELDVKMTSDGTAILSHDRTWGREWCGLSSLFGNQFDPFGDPNSSTNVAANSVVANTSRSSTRSFNYSTVLRDTPSISPTSKGNGDLDGCGPGRVLFYGAYPPTLQDAYDYIAKNHIKMVVALDIQLADAAKAALTIAKNTNDDQGHPFIQTTLFKIPITMFPNGQSDYNNLFGSDTNLVNFVPVITTSAIAPSNGQTLTLDTEDAGFDVADVGTYGFGSEDGIIKVLTNLQSYNPLGPIKMAAVEVGLKEPNGILTKVLNASEHNLITGRPMSIGQFQPVGEFYPPDNSYLHAIPKFFRSSNGTCCDYLSHYLYNNPDYGGPTDPSQPYDHSDQRANGNFIISVNGQYVITDDPATLAGQLGPNKRNTCYLKADYNPGSGCASLNSNNPSGIADGIYTIGNTNSGLAMDVTGGSTANGAAIEQWTPNGGPNQQWQAIAQTNGSTQLVSVKSGKCLDLSGGSTTPGATLDQYDCIAGRANQQFNLKATADGSYTMVVAQSGLAVEVPGGSMTPGAVLDQWTIDQGKNQEWTFTRPVPVTGVYTITNANSGLLMDVTGGSTNNNATIEQWTSNGGTGQQWQLTPLTGAQSGQFQLTSIKSGLCLDVSGGSTSAGGTLDQYTCFNQGNQHFILTLLRDGNYTIQGAQSGLDVEVPGASTTPGIVLDQQPFTQGKKSQEWTFNKIN